MEFKESIDVVLRESKFLLNEFELKRLLPDVEHYLPPLFSIRFLDKSAPKFIWGYPIIHSTRLLARMFNLIYFNIQQCLANPNYQENFRALSPEDLKTDPYFQELSSYLVKSLAEAPNVKLDSMIWIYLSDIVSRKLNQEVVFDNWGNEFLPEEISKMSLVDTEMRKLRHRDQKRYVEIKSKVLKSIFARNDFSNSCLKDVFDEVPFNPLNREMISNRLVFTEKQDSIYRSLDLQEAFLLKNYSNISHENFSRLNSVIRTAISGILQRVHNGNASYSDTFFVKQFVTDDVKMKSLTLPSQLQGQMASVLSTSELNDSDNREKMSYLLSLYEDSSRYIIFHLDEREIFKSVEKSSLIPKDFLKLVKQKEYVVTMEEGYIDVTRDLLRWDFYQTLKNRIRWISKKDGVLYCDKRPVDPVTTILNLDSFYDIYHKTRYGTAVFFDLISFTDRTKALTKELQEAAKKGNKERYSLSSIALCIQKIFSVRNHLGLYGGIAQGFEGDAILDLFPKALDALRYVTKFCQNYYKNQKIKLRPFEGSVDNPYRDGFRIGIASGEYSLVSVVGRQNEIIESDTQDRALGHVINKASRLNSGKKSTGLYLGMNNEKGSLISDPLNIFKVEITENQELVNNGIASYKETLTEILLQVKNENLPLFDSSKKEKVLIAGLEPAFKNYKFDFIFEDVRTKNIYLVRNVPGKAELKGLEDEIIDIYEYIIFDQDEYVAFLKKDSAYIPPVVAVNSKAVNKKLDTTQYINNNTKQAPIKPIPSTPHQHTGSILDKNTSNNDSDVQDYYLLGKPVASIESSFAEISRADEKIPSLANPPNSGFDWKDLVDEESFQFHAEFGIAANEILGTHSGMYPIPPIPKENEFLGDISNTSLSNANFADIDLEDDEESEHSISISIDVDSMHDLDSSELGDFHLNNNDISDGQEETPFVKNGIINSKETTPLPQEDSGTDTEQYQPIDLENEIAFNENGYEDISLSAEHKLSAYDLEKNSKLSSKKSEATPPFDETDVPSDINETSGFWVSFPREKSGIDFSKDYLNKDDISTDSDDKKDSSDPVYVETSAYEEEFSIDMSWGATDNNYKPADVNNSFSLNQSSPFGFDSLEEKSIELPDLSLPDLSESEIMLPFSQTTLDKPFDSITNLDLSKKSNAWVDENTDMDIKKSEHLVASSKESHTDSSYKKSERIVKDEISVEITLDEIDLSLLDLSNDLSEDASELPESSMDAQYQKINLATDLGVQGKTPDVSYDDWDDSATQISTMPIPNISSSRNDSTNENPQVAKKVLSNKISLPISTTPLSTAKKQLNLGDKNDNQSNMSLGLKDDFEQDDSTLLNTLSKSPVAFTQPSKMAATESLIITSASMPNLHQLLFGYVYGFVSANPLQRSSFNRLVVGYKKDMVIEDAHIYRVAEILHTPEVLDPIFKIFLQEKHQTNFEKSWVTWKVDDELLPQLRVVPIPRLVYLYKQLRLVPE